MAGPLAVWAVKQLQHVWPPTLISPININDPLADFLQNRDHTNLQANRSH